ncbi:Wzz/FepE/Etk N-terminal domain-containing protein [Chryseolinea sp. T2]|uniref:Wzz/FepE/Etk N-terminal domain-containing protein n=1 Tax=Chryseolinea sp. T2 TaxID=3129255 RepID=UPI0030777147
MVKTPDQGRGSDEIDLLDLFFKSVIVIRDNFWLIVIFFVVGTGIGVAYFMATKKQYESKMIIASNILTTSYAKILFDNANGHLRDGDYDVLSKQFNMPVETVKQIASLQIEYLTRAEGNDLKESDRYLITVRVYDQKILPALQEGLINHFENNEYVRIRVQQQKASLTQMLAAVEKELSDMQQFKGEIVNGKFFSSAKGNVMFDPTSVNSKIIELTQKKIDTKNNLELINSVQLIEGFSPFKHHVKPSFSISVVAGSMFGLIAVSVLIGFKSVRRILRMAEEKNTKNAA